MDYIYERFYWMVKYQNRNVKSKRNGLDYFGISNQKLDFFGMWPVWPEWLFCGAGGAGGTRQVWDLSYLRDALDQTAYFLSKSDSCYAN